VNSVPCCSIAVGNVTIGTESVYQPVTLTNTGGNPLIISSADGDEQSAVPREREHLPGEPGGGCQLRHPSALLPAGNGRSFGSFNHH